MQPLRVGIVDFLNSRPLAWGFLHGEQAELFAPSFHPPATVARMLAGGELDVGLVPSIEAARIPALRVLGDLCVSATHEVRSVLLVSRVDPAAEPEKIRRVALDRNSRTSAALLRILLAERWGANPETIEAQPDVDRMLETADAALVIGDPALRFHASPDRTHLHTIDLAAEWQSLTGLPFVFAVWAVREEAWRADLAVQFESSLRLGLASLDAIVRQAAAELDLDPGTVRAYLTENLSYRLEQAQRRGLEEFWRRARVYGLLAERKAAGVARG
jgi:chorismate dehydratase